MELDQVESEHQHQRLLGQRVGHHIGLCDAFAFFDLKLGKDTRTFTARRSIANATPEEAGGPEALQENHDNFLLSNRFSI